MTKGSRRRSDEAEERYSRCPPRNLLLDADFCRGRRSQPVWAGDVIPRRASVEGRVGSAAERGGCAAAGFPNRVNLQPMRSAQLLGDRPQHAVALEGVEAEHHEAWFGVHPEPSSPGGDLGHERVARLQLLSERQR